MAQRLKVKRKDRKAGAIKTGFQLAEVIHPRERTMLAQGLGWGVGPLVLALLLAWLLSRVWNEYALVLVGGWIVLGGLTYLVAAEISERKMLEDGEPTESARLKQMATLQARAIGLAPPAVTVSPLAPQVMTLGGRIAIPADLLRELSEGEQWALLAHELAHMRCHHVLWLNLLRRSRHASGVMKIPGVPVQMAARGLALWEPYANYSADRIALALTRDRRLLGQVLLKQVAFQEPDLEISGEEIVDYLNRPGTLQADGAEVTAHYKLGQLLRSQSGLHERLRHMASYAKTDGYKRAVAAVEQSYARAAATQKPPKAEGAPQPTKAEGPTEPPAEGE